MAVRRAFPAENVVAVFEEAAGGGDMQDLNAPRNAPAKAPQSYLAQLYLHTALDYYTIAVQNLAIVINHASVAGVAAVPPPPPDDINNTPGNVTIVHEGQTVAADYLLLQHDLGYVPNYRFLQGTRFVPAGVPTQVEGGRVRFVYAYATTTQIRLREIGISDANALSAVSRTYGVVVFRAPAADPAKPLFGFDGTNVILGRDKINSSRRTMRLTGIGDSPYKLPLGQGADVLNGGLRVYATDGTAIDYGSYNDSFPPPALMDVAF